MRPIRPLPSKPSLLARSALATLALTWGAWGGAVACGGDSGGSDTSTATDTSVTTGGTDTGTQPDTSGTNAAPELERIGDRVVAVGKTLTITLVAKDADNDDLTYSVFGNLPDGARFDKAEHKFEWSPTEAGKTVFLTFVVSDGTDFDRETVRIQVTATSTTNPPAFVDVGDQIVTPGASFTLTLAANDPDGDALTFGHDGALPDGASLDEKSGRFDWRVPATVASSPVRITFTVSDGTASDSLAVNFIVDDGSGSVPKPPVFTPPGSVSAKVGQPLSLTLSATDPNGAAVTFSIKSGAPTGATLDGATFAWTPAAGDVGQTFTVTFAATDGTFTALGETKINVTSGQTGSCTPDAEEPNEDIAGAKPLAVGTRQATLCDSDASYDIDVWSIAIPEGQALTATLTFDAAEADLDLELYNANQDLVAASDGVSSQEVVRFAPPAAGTYYLVVFGYALEPLHLTYTLATALGAPQVCDEDTYEDNDTAANATPLSDEVQNAHLQICADDADFYSFPVQCGAHVEVLMDIKDGADLDLYLYSDEYGIDEIASAITEESLESIDVTDAPAGNYVLEVDGYPASTAESGYELLVDVTGGCEDDSRANHSASRAVEFSGLAQGAICCGDDWFLVPLQAGEKATVEVTVDTTGSVGGAGYAPDGTTQLAAKEPSPGGGSFSFSATTAGSYYVKVSGTTGTTYLLDVSVTAATVACDAKSCDKGDVCDSSNGSCVSDFCFDTTDCPSGYTCQETYCADACTANTGCRQSSGYLCKEAVGARFCGLSGTGAAGATCSDHSDCEGQAVCLFLDHGGYCAEASCSSCTAGTKCASFGGQALCAKTCNVAGDCRDGYTCTAEKTCLPNP
ncbi:MAG: pre-peptidase C-terminal domain-containing protein [Myxococcota bacterium]